MKNLSGEISKITKPLCIAGACFVLLPSSGKAADKKKDKRPNVIIIMTDDQGYGELSCNGNPILKTPNLDRLHDQSLRLTNFHVAPMCTPTRGQLLTGVDAVRNGALNVSSGRALLRKEFPTIADIYSGNGYETGIFGKWHLGDNYPFRPEDRGFNETLWFPSSAISSVPDYWGNNYFDPVFIRNGKRAQFKGYCTDVFFNNAMDWMKKCSEEGKPFFTYLPTNAAHNPHIAPAKYVEEMRSVVENSKFSNLDSSIKHGLIRYLAMIRNIDDNVGNLMEFLKKEGFAGNTILIFLTDNGSTFGPDYYNAGMRGRKTEIYEGGHRVPFFIRWPDGKGFDKPRDINGLSEVQDVLPTLLDLCGLEYNRKSFEGKSLAPVFQENKSIPEDRVLFINYSRMPGNLDYPSPYAASIINEEGAAVLWKQWRLLNKTELYDLSADPLQQNNVINKNPQVVDFLSGKLNEWWSAVKDIANKPERVIIGDDKENPSLLTSCEWMDVFLDRQVQVQMGWHRNSYWLLQVAEKGTYEFELRRWPCESKICLTGNDTIGVADNDETMSLNSKDLPIAAARIFINTEDRKINMKKLTLDGDQSVIFTCELNKGPIALHTWFDDKNNEPIAGAYYVYVTKK
ncbi:MAG: arylsulfatase [Prolixibacteraceae bacterium]